MLMLTAAPQSLGFLDAGITAVLGYGVVFLGLIALMIVVSLMSKLLGASVKKSTVVVETPTPNAAPTAPGSAGALKLHNVEPKTAAMLMAIVADKLGKPLNELRFISIKEVE